MAVLITQGSTHTVPLTQDSPRRAAISCIPLNFTMQFQLISSQYRAVRQLPCLCGFNRLAECLYNASPAARHRTGRFASISAKRQFNYYTSLSKAQAQSLGSKLLKYLVSTRHFITEQTMTIQKMEIRRKSVFKIVSELFMDSNLFKQLDWLPHHCIHKVLCFLAILLCNMWTFGLMTGLEHCISTKKKG